jgi:TRAP-type C4-dicarboxylate transport system permease small subunit
VVDTASDPDFDAPVAPTARSPFQRFADILAAIGTVWIFLLMFLIVADVLGRNFLNKPITGVAEFAGRSVVAIIFLQLGSGISAGLMTRSDFVLRILGRRSERMVSVLEAAYAVFGSALFALLAIISWPEAAQAWKGNEFFGVQGVFTMPLWPFRWLIVLGSCMACCAYLLLALERLRSTSPGRGSA